MLDEGAVVSVPVPVPLPIPVPVVPADDAGVAGSASRSAETRDHSSDGGRDGSRVPVAVVNLVVSFASEKWGAAMGSHRNGLAATKTSGQRHSSGGSGGRRSADEASGSFGGGAIAGPGGEVGAGAIPYAVIGCDEGEIEAVVGEAHIGPDVLDAPSGGDGSEREGELEERSGWEACRAVDGGLGLLGGVDDQVTNSHRASPLLRQGRAVPCALI